jgi:hypothetical protein
MRIYSVSANQQIEKLPDLNKKETDKMTLALMTLMRSVQKPDGLTTFSQLF